jgi:hypothetical protein
VRGEAVDVTLTGSPQFISHGSASNSKRKKERIDTEDYKRKKDKQAARSKEIKKKGMCKMERRQKKQINKRKQHLLFCLGSKKRILSGIIMVYG